MIDTSIIESPRRDTSPQVYAGLPARAYVPNPYDFGRPAIVYPGDSVYYSAPEPHDKSYHAHRHGRVRPGMRGCSSGTPAL